MAGAGKHRARKERKNGNDGNGDNNGKHSPPSPETQNSPSSNSPPQQTSPTRFDGGADPGTTRPTINPNNNGNNLVAVRAHRNLDLGLHSSYIQAGYDAPRNLPKRPQGLNPTGQTIKVRLNHFPVETLPSKPIYQYDVTIGRGNETPAVNKKAFSSSAVRNELDVGWIYDQNKIAYSLRDRGPGEIVIKVDFDAEQGRQPRIGSDGQPRPDLMRVVVKKAKTVRLDSLQAYLEGRLPHWDNNCLEAITFLDHLLRECPSQKYTVQKRSFFHRGQTRSNLGGGIEAMKGVYSSVRPVSSGLRPPSAPGRLSINVDVANTTFWAAQPLHVAAKDLVGVQDLSHLVQVLRPTNREDPESREFKLLRRLKRVTVQCQHRDPKNLDKYTIDKFIMKNAQQQKMPFKDPNTGQEQQLSVFDYFRRKYSIVLQYPQLPLVKMTKGVSTYLPMELCRITENQRYGFKLSDRQTSEMIKFAVTLPNQRWQDIQQGLTMFNWGGDQYLANYGLKVLGNGSQPSTVTAKLLPPPKVRFGANGEAAPQYSGRWDLRGKRFIEPNSSPLQSWGVCIVPGRFRVDQSQARQFIQTFIRIYEGHGGRVSRKDPLLIAGVQDPAKCVEMLWTQAGNQSRQAPQLLVFIVPSKDSDFYNRIKKSADCRYGVVSQVLQAAHVQKAQAQYCSNVAMKVNAKLGGVTAQAHGIRADKGGWINRPTMYVGADVSHAAPGVEGASIAAITVSFDKRGVKYAGLVETNGQRVEMITKDNWENVFGLLCDRWMQTLGQGKAPAHLVYFRDGVSEGQYAHVLEQEVRDLRSVLKTKDPKASTLITVLTCTKRHHVRFFPDKGDRNGNPMPGTLVQDGCTAPFEYDFYLCAHAAIKGTARPVHYFVLLDEAKLGQEELQNMIYEASYQYVRSTTPVSLFPAIYYAHLAAARGTSHINQPSRSSGPEDQTHTHSSGREQQTEIPKLLNMPNSRGIKGTMWYV